MKRFVVITPEWGEVVPVLDYGQGPMEYGCDVVLVQADTPSKAKSAAVKFFRVRYHGHSPWSDTCPFTGLKVEQYSYRRHGALRDWCGNRC